VGEARRCPGCGYTKFGICPGCFPELAERERQVELAEWRFELAEQERREAGMLMCPEHQVHDRCWSAARPERRTMTWRQAMDQLWAKYAPPG
jgi:hypothetical protein